MPIPMSMPPMIVIGGPVFRLRYLGPVCPCLERPGDGAAREALQKCTGLPIRYHRRVARGVRGDGGSSALAAAMSSAVSGLFGGGGGGGGGGREGGDASSSSAAGGGASFVKGPATLTVVDTPGGPALRVETEPDEQREGATRMDEDGTVRQVDTRHRRTVPLRKIATIRAIDGSFLGVGGGPSLVAVVGRARGSPELLRFNVLDAAGKRKAEDAGRRDEVIGRLGGLVEWDRRRRAAAGDTDNNNDNENAEQHNDDDEDAFENDEDGGSTSRRGAVPKGRAAKAAYFAKREIELTKQRREREKRKARYLEGSGGLKYTAIAMASKGAEMT